MYFSINTLGFEFCKIRINRTTIFPVVLCGYETRSLTWMEKSKLRTLENRLLMRIFGPKREEVTEE